MTTTPEPPAEVEDLRAEIAQIRQELGETVEELAARADVKARLHDRAEAAKAEVRERAHELAGRAEDQVYGALQRAGGFTSRHRIQLLALAGAAGLVLLIAGWRHEREARRWRR